MEAQLAEHFPTPANALQATTHPAAEPAAYSEQRTGVENGARNCRLWRKPRDQHLDLAFRFVAGRIKYFPMVFRRQVLAQQADRSERQLAAHEPVEHQWVPSRGAGRLDAPVCGVLRQVQDLCAIGEKRGAALAEIECSRPLR